MTTSTLLPPDRSYPSFSKEEFARRFRQIRDRMDAADVELVVVCGRGARNPDVLYLSNWLSTSEAWVLFPRDGESTMLVQLSNHVPLARIMANTPDVRFGGSAPTGSVDTVPTLIEALKERGVSSGRVGLVGLITWREHARLVEAFPAVQWVDFGAQMRDQRQVKSAEEMERLSISARMCDLSAMALAEQARPGLTEHDLAKIVEDTYLAEGGVNGIHFMVSTSMSDPRGGVPCQHLSDRVLQRGDVLVVELSTNYMGYTAQILRSYTIDAEPTPVFADMHDVAMEVFDRVASVIRDGSTVPAILDAAEVAARRGYTIYDDLVHGAGQLPAIVRTRQTYRGEPEGFRYREGMCLVIQPNVVTEGALAGVQFGEMMQVTATGLEPLHNFSREFIRCGG
jgi:Xaa-Pro dipeptidase